MHTKLNQRKIEVTNTNFGIPLTSKGVKNTIKYSTVIHVLTQYSKNVHNKIFRLRQTRMRIVVDKNSDR